MAERINPYDRKWDDYYPEPSVFERTETPHVYKFLFINKHDPTDRIEVECQWGDLRTNHQDVMDYDYTQKIRDEDRSTLT